MWARAPREPALSEVEGSRRSKAPHAFACAAFSPKFLSSPLTNSFPRKPLIQTKK